MYSKHAIIFMAIMVSLSIFSLEVDAEEQIQEITIEESVPRSVETATETNETEDKTILETLEDALSTVIDAFVGMVTAVPRAISTVFSNWADGISGPVGLLIAGGVFFLLYLLIRFTGLVDMFLDRLN